MDQVEPSRWFMMLRTGSSTTATVPWLWYNNAPRARRIDRGVYGEKVMIGGDITYRVKSPDRVSGVLPVPAEHAVTPNRTSRLLRRTR